MVTTTQKAPATGQQGFTLVELAIVLVIVGLLIGGILKGQELIANTRINSTVSQVKAITAAVNTFQDTYQALPGDMANAITRLPNCAAGTACGNAAGNGDGSIGVAGGIEAAMAAGSERLGFFNQLYVADLISGVTNTDNLVVGQGVLGATLSNSIHYRIGRSAAGAAPLVDVFAGTNPQPGHYLLLTGLAPGAALAAGGSENSNGLTPKQAMGMDNKLDDGIPTTGSTIGGNNTATAAAAGCTNNAVATSIVYNTQNSQGDCSLYVRVMQ